MLVSEVEETDGCDVLGEWSPGLKRFRRLEKTGIVYITEEEPISLSDGTSFEPTPSIELNY